MIIDETNLIQVYATVLTGILIFMTVQRLFEGKDNYEKESKRLNVQKRDAEMGKDEYEKNLPVPREVEDRNDPYLIELEHYEGLIREQDAEIAKINTQIKSLDNRYKRKNDQYRSIRKRETRLNMAMISLIVSAIIILLLVPYYGRGISIIIFSISIILIIWRVYLHGQEVV